MRLQLMTVINNHIILKCFRLKSSILRNGITRRMSAQVPNCIFCQIISDQAPATIVYKDDAYLVFKDIKPVSENHLLVVPLKHIQDVKSLTSMTTGIVEEMVSIGQKVVSDNGADLKDCRMGFHWPPFNSIKHLHLHVIFPENRTSFVGRQLYRPGTFYFATPEVTIEWLKKHRS